MRFGYACPAGHEVVATFPTGAAPDDVLCSEHGYVSSRVYEAFYTQEDRRGMSASKPGKPGWSWALGAPMPTSRAEMRAIEKTQGIEFVTPSEARADAAKLREGKNLDEPVKPEKGYLAREVAKRGIRFDRSLTPPRTLTREESERKLKAERPDWTSAGVKDLGTPKLPA